MTTNNPEAGPSKTNLAAQEGKTEFYQNIQNKELERRQKITDAMTWLRPIDRLMKRREIARIDGLLVRISATLEQSRAADAVIQEASQIIAYEIPGPAEAISAILPELSNNTATETVVSVVEDR